MKITLPVLLLTFTSVTLFGCTREPAWTIDTRMQQALNGSDPGEPELSVPYLTSDGGQALLWTDDKSAFVNDDESCKRRLVRYSAFYEGNPPKSAGSIAYAAQPDNTQILVWIDSTQGDRWATFMIPKGQQWMPLVQSFVREVMAEPQAAKDLAKAKDTNWNYGSSVIATKFFGEVELAPEWFLEFEVYGAPPDDGERSFLLKGHRGGLDFAETTPDRLTSVGHLKYAGFEIPKIDDGITRIYSQDYPDNVAFLIRKGERIVVLVAGVKPDEAFLDETAKLAEFFLAALEE